MSHERFADWDAAYVLGSLSPADRASYEEHLASCATCREAVAEIAPLPGLLSRIPRERAEALGAEVPGARAEASGAAGAARGATSRQVSDKSAANRNGLVGDLSTRRRLVDSRRHRRRIAWVAMGAAAVVALGVAIAIPFLTAGEDPGETVALERVIDAPLDASVDLTPVAWGTRIEMTCEYGQDPSAPPQGRDYALVVVSDDGIEHELSTWRAYAESTAQLSAGTALDPDEIDAVEIRAIPDGPVLLRAELPSE